MGKVNRNLITIFTITLTAILVIIPLGLIYRLIDAYQFLQNCPDKSCGTWIGILAIILLPAELYLWMVLKWQKVLPATQTNETIKFIQLLLVFILGVMPGMLSIYAVLIK